MRLAKVFDGFQTTRIFLPKYRLCLFIAIKHVMKTIIPVRNLFGKQEQISGSCVKTN